MEALKAEVAKLEEEPKVISVHGPELMAVAEDSPNKRMQVHFVIPSLSVSVKSSKKVIWKEPWLFSSSASNGS